MLDILYKGGFMMIPLVLVCSPLALAVIIDRAVAFHKHRKYDYYGRKLDGHTLGAPGTLGAWEKKHRASD